MIVDHFPQTVCWKGGSERNTMYNASIGLGNGRPSYESVFSRCEVPFLYICATINRGRYCCFPRACEALAIKPIVSSAARARALSLTQCPLSTNRVLPTFLASRLDHGLTVTAQKSRSKQGRSKQYIS